MDEGRSSRSGSAVRKRSAGVFVRLTPAEFANVTERAAAAGLSLGGYLRAAGTGTAGPRARHKPVQDAELLRMALRAIGALGNNVNQIAAAVNRGELDVDNTNLEAAVADIRMLRAGVMKALGRAP